MKTSRILFPCLLAAALALAACNADSGQPAADRSQPAPTETVTPQPSPTQTPTVTETPEPSLTPTETLTPTPEIVYVGGYVVNEEGKLVDEDGVVVELEEGYARVVRLEETEMGVVGMDEEGYPAVVVFKESQEAVKVWRSAWEAREWVEKGYIELMNQKWQEQMSQRGEEAWEEYVERTKKWWASEKVNMPHRRMIL